MKIRNFGRNLCFSPRQFAAPANEQELLDLLRQHRRGNVRVVGSRHAWSPGIQTDDLLIDMRHFRGVRLYEVDGLMFATIGAGCPIKKILSVLNRHGLTLPSIGLISEQTIAGATATGTHGSGKHSLSHYIASARVACYDEHGETPRIVEITGGVDLRAVRCSLGCLGVVVELTLPCVPQYYVEEQAAACDSIEQALACEAETPLQQFFLLPHTWSYLVQRRRVVSGPGSRWNAGLFRVYWFLALDVGLHLLVKLFASWLGSRRLVHQLFRRIIPALVFPRWVVVDRSDRALIMEHELFRHLELEVFVRRSQVVEAAHFVTEILRCADDAQFEISPALQATLRAEQLLDSLQPIRGQFTHHYPICFRRVLPDDTLLSMASGGSEDWYAISFITYVEPRDSFYALARFLAVSMCVLFQARSHWGKWFPLSAEQVRRVYPDLDLFRGACRRHDPRGVFRNDFLADTLGPIPECPAG